MGALAERIVENAADAIIVADRRGIVQEWNSSTARMFGFTVDKALGSNLNLIIPKKAPAVSFARLRQGRANG